MLKALVILILCVLPIAVILSAVLVIKLALREQLTVSDKQMVPEGVDQAELDRQYFPVLPSQMARNFHTHVQVQGIVRYIKKQGDGDTHILLCDEGVTSFDRKACVVVECIPKLPCKPPKIRQKMLALGISRIDGEHKWPEIHPVESLEVVK